jgi:hypothetical protein
MVGTFDPKHYPLLTYYIIRLATTISFSDLQYLGSEVRMEFFSTGRRSYKARKWILVLWEKQLEWLRSEVALGILVS